MEKIKNIICLLSCLACTINFAGSPVAADIMPPTQAQSAYSFGPEGRTIDSLQDFATPNKMMSILPNRPVAATEKDGSHVFFTPDGNMTLTISPNGTKTFALGGNWNTQTYDAEGNLQQQTQQIKGTDETLITNEKGQTLGYQELGYGGQVVKTYDAQKNLTSTYTYDKYAKNVSYVLNELSMTKTVYGSNGQPQEDIDFEGHVIARYTSDQEGRLATKVDNVGNTTYFDTYGNMTHTTNYTGYTTLAYNYAKDDDGRYVLNTAVEYPTGDTTYYTNGKQQYTMNSSGVKTTEYYWSGSTLVYSFDTGLQQTTYYDINNKQLYTAINGTMLQQWLYMNGRLVGYYDGNNHSTILYQYERNDITVATDNEPTAAQIQQWYDSGLIEKLKGATAN